MRHRKFLMHLLLTSLGILFLSAATIFVSRRGGVYYLALKFGLTKRVFSQDMSVFDTMRSVFDVLPVHEGDIVFVGNSITANCPWHELFENNRIRNRGIGAESTAGALARIDSLAAAGPSKLFLQLGRSDIVYGVPIDRIIANMREIIRRTRDHSATTHIYIQSEIPWFDTVIKGRDFSNHTIVALNQELAKLAAEESAIFIDVAAHFTAPDGQLVADFSFDGVHPNGEGYRLWKRCTEKYVEE